MKWPRSSFPFSVPTVVVPHLTNASLAARRLHSSRTYVDLRFPIARNGPHVLDDAEQFGEDERCHCRNEVTKKKSTTTPQNEFSSWRRSLVKNQRAVPRFNSMRPRHPKPPESPGKRCNCDARWETRTGLVIHTLVVPNRRTARHEEVQSAYGSVLLCVMQCAPPRSPSSILTQEVAREVQRVSR